MQIENNQPPADQEPKCIMKPKKPIVHKAYQAEMVINGTYISIPSRLLFAADDGSVYVVCHMNETGGARYVSLTEWIDNSKKGRLMEFLSGK